MSGGTQRATLAEARPLDGRAMQCDIPKYLVQVCDQTSLGLELLA